MVSSYSQLEKFEKCPNSWALRYISKNKVDVKSKHLEYGLALHETLEFIFNDTRSKYKIPLPFVYDLYNYNFNKRNIPFDNEIEEMEWRMEGMITLESLILQQTTFDQLLMGSKIIGVEMPFEIPIHVDGLKLADCFFNTENLASSLVDYDTVYIKGFIDLVVETEQGIIVIDHKSGGKVFDKHKLTTDLQFPIYGMAINSLLGKYPIKYYYNFTRLHKSQIVEVNEQRIKDENERIIADFKKMGRGKYTARPTPLCYWCDYSRYKTGICLKSSTWKPKPKEDKKIA